MRDTSAYLSSTSFSDVVPVNKFMVGDMSARVVFHLYFGGCGGYYD